jgi:valyl-tRNA synthetase
MSELGAYDPKAIQDRCSRLWKQGHYFEVEVDSGKPPYSIVMPPPNVTGVLHLGHALNNTLQDVLVRWKRMEGFAAVWMAGADHAGIATQAVVEKSLRERENKTRHDIGRCALVERIWAWKDQCESRIVQQLHGIGCSFDSRRWRFTLDEQCSKAVRHAFFKMFREGLIFRGKRLVNWDVQLQTAVADDELENKDVDGNLWHFRYLVEGGDEKLVIATTRPETMLGDTAVAVHPSDPRYQHLIGKHVRLPLMNRLIPIIADGKLVDMAFGTGVVKVTPAHDPNDWACGQRNNLDVLNVMTPEGRINENGGKYAGLPRFEARKAVVADMDALGLLDSVKPHKHNVPHSDRSKTPIEPYLSDQWFVRMAPLADEALKAVEDGRIKFHPPRYADNYLRWLGERRDWCISRQLWWGHRIPVWRLPTLAADEHAVKTLAKRLEAKLGPPENRWSMQSERAETGFDLHVCLLNDDQELIAALEEVGLKRDPDVLDTWFSSGLWPISVFGWPEKTPELDFFYPTSVLSTAREIITLWVARMVAMGLFCHGEIPFREVYIHAVIMDGQGEKMSKTKGNGVDPFDIIDAFGADALRFTLAHLATETQDVRMPVTKSKLPDGREVNTSAKFELGRNFGTKVFNAAKLILTNLEGFEPGPAENLADEDRWILHRLDETVEAATAALDGYRFSEYARVMYDFVWGSLCDWYLEMVKPRWRGEGETKLTAQRVSAAVLDKTLRLLHPLMPFVSEEIWQAMKSIASGAEEALVVAKWPSPDSTTRSPEAAERVSGLQQVIAAVRNMRSQYNINPKEEIAVLVECPQALADYLTASKNMALHLAKIKEWTCGPAVERPSGSAAQILQGAKVYLPFGSLIDRLAEITKQQKKRSDLEKRLAGARGKLENEAFIGKAPAEVVEQLRASEREFLEQIAAINGVILDLQA